MHISESATFFYLICLLKHSSTPRLSHLLSFEYTAMNSWEHNFQLVAFLKSNCHINTTSMLIVAMNALF